MQVSTSGCFHLSVLVNNPALSVFFISGFKIKFDPSSQGVPRVGEPGLVPAPCPARTSTQTRALSVIAFLCSLEGASFPAYQSLLRFLSRPLSQVHITWPNPESRELTAAWCELTGRVLRRSALQTRGPLRRCLTSAIDFST